MSILHKSGRKRGANFLTFAKSLGNFHYDQTVNLCQQIVCEPFTASFYKVFFFSYRKLPSENLRKMEENHTLAQDLGKL